MLIVLHFRCYTSWRCASLMPHPHPWSSEPCLFRAPDPVHWTRLTINPKLANQGVLLGVVTGRMKVESREKERERELLCVVILGLGARAEIKVLPGLVLSEGWGRIGTRPLSLACSWPSSPCVPSHCLPSICICLCVQISPFYKGTNHIALGPALMISF